MKSTDMALQKLPIHETSRTNWTHLTIFSLLVLLIADLIWSSPIKSDPTFKLFVKVFTSKKVVEFSLIWILYYIICTVDELQFLWVLIWVPIWMEVFVKFGPFLFYIGLAVCWSYSQPIIEQTINTSKVIFLLMLRETGIPLLRETGIPLSHSVTQPLSHSVKDWSPTA